LIGSALGNVNATPTPEGWGCPKDDTGCTSINEPPQKLAAYIMSDVAKSPRSFKDDWSDQDYDIGQLDENPESLSWPELGDAATCERVDDQTSLMIPAQVRSLQPPHFSAHIVRAARLSSSLDSSLRKLTTTFGRQKSFHNFVQAYFISPDSVLRIWTRRNANVCQEFSKSR
jgi:hypothetical protein